MLKHIKIFFNQEHKKLLFLFFSADLFFLFLHFLNAYSQIYTPILSFQNPVFSLTEDLSLGESYQYIKELWIIILFGVLIVRYKNFLYAGWMSLFGYFIIDDLFMVHENLGTVFTDIFAFTPQFGLRAQDFGELTVIALFGSFFISLIIIGYFRSDNTHKKVCRSLFVLLGILVFFGVFADMVHSAVDENMTIVRGILGTIEDGGEMISMSLLCWFVFNLTEKYLEEKKESA